MERLWIRETTRAVPKDVSGARQKLPERRPVVRAAPAVLEIADAGSRDRLRSRPDAGHRIQRSTAAAVAITGPPAGSRIHRASGRVIQRVVKSTQIGKRKVTKYYTTLDTKPNRSLFDTPEQAAALESRILAASSNTKSAATVVPTTSKIAPSISATPEVLTTPPVAETPRSYASMVSGKPSTPVITSPTAKTPTPIITSPTTKTPTPIINPTAKTIAPVVAEPKPLSPEELWYAKQEEVLNAMAPFVARFKALDPASSLRIRGSLASGFKGETKKLENGERALFDPTNFDIDAYVVSDKLYNETLTSDKTTDVAVRGKIAGSHHPKVNEIIRDMRKVLAKIPGNRDALETWQFNVIIRSGRNAKFIESGDIDDIYNLGYDYLGYLGVPEPVVKGKK